jgi:DNA-binding Lrp family transcriptional regulator
VDLVVRLVSSDIGDFGNLLHKKLARIPGIVNVNSLMVLEELSNTPPLVSGSESP